MANNEKHVYVKLASYDSDGFEQFDSSGNPVGNVVAEESVIKKPQIIPTISGAATGEIFLDALGAVAVAGVKITVNPGDSVNASERLAAGQPDTINIYDGDTVEIHSTANITNVTIAMIAEEAVTEAAYNATTKVATGTLYSSLVVADFLTVLVQFDFDTADAVNMVSCSLKTFSDGTTADNLGIFKIAGYSQ